MVTFGERLKQLRTEKDVTLDQLARDLGTTKATLSRYENGKRRPGMDLITAIANYFNVSTDFLLGHDIEKQNETAHKRIAEAISDNPELLQFWEQLSQRDDLQLLFKQTKDLTPAAIKRIIEIIKIIEDEEQRNQ